MVDNYIPAILYVPKLGSGYIFMFLIFHDLPFATSYTIRVNAEQSAKYKKVSLHWFSLLLTSTIGVTKVDWSS